MALDVREQVRYCSRCGVDCTHKSRFRDRRGRYLCATCHDLLARTVQVTPPPRRPSPAHPDASTAARFRAARLAALQQAARAHAPVSDPRRQSCPSCARRLPRDVFECPACGILLSERVPDRPATATPDEANIEPLLSMTFRVVCLVCGLAIAGSIVWAAMLLGG